jgi:hypothetical protein
VSCVSGTSLPSSLIISRGRDGAVSFARSCSSAIPRRRAFPHGGACDETGEAQRGLGGMADALAMIAAQSVRTGARLTRTGLLEAGIRPLGPLTLYPAER